MRNLSKTFGLLLVLFAISLLGRPAEAKYGGGSGTVDDPYLIYTAEQMNAIGAEPNDWDKHFNLMADIDLNSYRGREFNIIGINFWDFNQVGPIRIKIPFTGTFDGNGHTISNFTYVRIEADDTGLFGYVNDPNARIRDLGLIDPNVAAGVGDRVGSL
ncbi:MAG: hypothetical protein ACE5NM_05725, partial [Sedimentisphaerales bacterium]